MNPTIATWMLFLHVLAALWLAAGVFAGSVVRAQGRKAATLGERSTPYPGVVDQAGHQRGELGALDAAAA